MKRNVVMGKKQYNNEKEDAENLLIDSVDFETVKIVTAFQNNTGWKYLEFEFDDLMANMFVLVLIIRGPS